MNSPEPSQPSPRSLSRSPSPLSSSSSSSSSSPDIPSLQAAVSSTNALSAHTALITALRERADLASLRAAFRAAYTAHTLPASVWHAHLTEEAPLASTVPAKNALLDLHTRALHDTMAPLVHAARVAYAARLVAENILHHPVYERIIEEAHRCGAGYDPRFRELCARLPRVRDILRQPPPEHRIFEKRLSDTPPGDAGVLPRASIYLSYARFAEAHPEFAIAIYERGLSEPHAAADLWKAYDAFLMHERHPEREKVLRRACRAVPSELELWRRLVLIVDADGLERVLHDVKPFVMSSHDLPAACRLTKDVWTRYYTLGCPGSLSECVIGSLEFNVPESEEWASTCMHAGEVLLQSRKYEYGKTLVESVLKARPEARWWLLYAGMLAGTERRQAYERGVRAVGTIAEVHMIRDAWEVFELRDARDGLKAGMVDEGDRLIERMRMIAKAVAVREGERMKITDRGERRGKPAKRRRAERTADGKKGNDKGRKVTEAGKGIVNGVDEELKVQNGEDKMEDVTDGGKKTTDVNATTDGNNAGTAGTEKGEKVAKGGVEPKTVFLNNLPFSITEADLQEAFAFAGAVKQIRLPRRSDGASKGIAYIEFGDEEAVDKALTRHNKPIKGRAVWVRRSKPPPKGRKPARGGGAARGGSRGRRRLVVHPPRKDGGEGEGGKDGDVVMRDEGKTAGLGQDDFRAMFLK